MRVTHTSLLALCLAFAAAGAHADDKWNPYVDFGGKVGTDRSIGEASLFAPIMQNDTTMLFGDLRGQFDDQSNSEGNFGFGVRRMLASGWNVGAYGFYDRRSTESGSRFNQATFGAEALSVDWDLRANGYQPFGDKSNTIASFGSGGAPSASLVGSSIIITIPGGGKVVERALPGFDGEVGWRIPVFGAGNTMQLRGYVGGFYFDDSQTDAIAGPRARLNLEVAEVPQLWNGARIDIGAEVQHDNVRDTQAFATLRLRIPLQDPSHETKLATLSPIERRMMDPVMRDVDIVSGKKRTGSGGAGTTETATMDASGNTLIVAGDSSTLAADVAAAGVNSTVVVAGSLLPSSTIVMQTGQTLVGSGATISVKGASNQVASLTLSGSSSILLIAAGPTTVQMAPSSTIDHVGITAFGNGTGTAVEINNDNGAAIRNSSISGATASGTTRAVTISNSNNVVIDSSSLDGSSTSGTAIALDVSGSGNVTVSDTSLGATSTGGPTTMMTAGTSTFNAGSTGNTRGSGACTDGGGNTGNVTFTNTTTCP